MEKPHPPTFYTSSLTLPMCLYAKQIRTFLIESWPGLGRSVRSCRTGKRVVMTRRLLIPPLAALTIVLYWMASAIGIGNRADRVFAQDTGGAAERRTVVIERDPVRTVED